MYKLSNVLLKNDIPYLQYSSSYSVFDGIIKNIETIYCFNIHQDEQLKNYSLVCMNNCLPDSAEFFVDQCSKNQSVGIYIHHMISDIYYNDNIKNMFDNLTNLPFCHSLSFSEKSDNEHMIYGLPKYKKDINNNTRKNILILSNPLTKNSSINLKQSIQTMGIDCDILDNIHTLDIEQVYEIFSSYKLVIDNWSYINLITAAYCGAKVMTASNNLIKEAFISRLHPESHTYVKNLLADFSVDTGLVAYLEKKYEYEGFIKKFTTTLNNINQELFYI